MSAEARTATASAEARRAKEEGGSVTHHVRDDRDGFREALNPSYDLLNRFEHQPAGRAIDRV